jgi:ATP-dependent Clp protease ATP-binding subunit ClpA
MISKELSATLGFAVREAKKRRHEYVSIEHILFAILYDPTGMDIIENCGGSVENLITSLEEFFEEKIEQIPDSNEYVLQQTIGFQRVIQRAVNHARSAEKSEVTVSDILASIFLEKDSHAEYFLSAEGISRLDVLNFISHNVSKTPDEDSPAELTRPAKEKRKKKSNPLELYISWIRSSAAKLKWNARCRSCAADVRITRYMSVIRESAKPPWPKVWPSRSRKAMFRTCSRMLRYSPLILAECWPAPNSGVILNSD